MSTTLKRKRGDALDLGSSPQAPPAPKITAACTACRKQKIKCDMPNEAPPCTRCQRRGLTCVLHTSTTRSASADHKQIGLLGEDVVNIFTTLQAVCSRLDMGPPQPLKSIQDSPDNCNNSMQSADPADESEVYELSPPASPSTLQAPIEPYLSSAHSQQNPSLPDGSTTNGIERPRRRPSERPDLISQGLVSLDLAELLVQQYLLHFDRFLYGITSHYRDATEVRRASPTLLAVICAVSAFHNAEHKDVFGACYREYRALVSASLFEKKGIEFIRALCIGTFWLLDASRILLSDAIRRAADCRLHSEFRHLSRITSSMAKFSASPSSTVVVDASVFSDKLRDESRDKIRLWYLLFISDRHLTILHNRDSLIWQEKEAIEKRDLFLTDNNIGSGTSQLDIRLMSQVSLLVIMGQIRDVIGCEQAKPILKSYSVHFSHFAHELDQWYDKFAPSFEPDQYIGTFPLAGLKMHYQYGRLYLAHHIFRGLSDGPIPVHWLPQATAAHEAAVSIFVVILENEAFRTNIVGMPPYFHIMIFFAGHFLLEVVMKHREQLGLALEEGFERVAAVLSLFSRTPAMPQHPIKRAVTGLTRKLNECTAILGMESILMVSPSHNNANEDASLMMGLHAGGIHDDNNNNVRGCSMADGVVSSLDMGAMGGLSDDLLYTDFGDFDMTFAGSRS